MGWEERIKEASYTGPSGKKFVFGWDETEESFDHKASVFRFPNKDGAEIPDQGTGEHRFPITTFTNGDDYDLEAQKFMDILAEKGNGVLVTPLYGTKSVQPTNIKRIDKVTEEGNQATISVLFLESKKILVQETKEDVKKKIEQSQDDFDKETPEEFETQKRTDSPQDLANSEARFTRNISTIDELLGPIAVLNDEVNSFFNAVSLSLNSNLTDLVGKPLTLASQTLSLIKAPARIVQSFALRIQGYTDLATELRNRATIGNITNDTRNTLLETRFMLSGCVAALAETMLLEDFKTKADALVAAQILQDFHALNRDFIEGEESKFQNSPLELLLYGDSEEAKNLLAIVERSANQLIVTSFDLQQERTIELARDRNIIDLSFELFGNFDGATLDTLINTNNLKADEIILIKKGREIVYYV